MAQDVDTPPDFREQGEQLAMGALSPPVVEKQGKFVVSLVYEIAVRLVEFLIGAASQVAIKLAGLVMKAEDRNAPAFRELTRAAIKDLTGADPGSGHRAIGKTLLNSLAGGGGAQSGAALTPSTEGAEAYMEIVMQLALEGYVEGGITSAISAGFLDKFTELDDILANVLGLGRMSRAVMRPLMTAKVITPFQWHVNQQYRPELLSAGAAIEAFLANRFTGPQLTEELTRQGWSDERIQLQVENARKRLSFTDLVYQHQRGVLADTEVITRAAALGFDEYTARELLNLELAKQLDRWRGPVVDAAVAAYIAREIEEPELRRLVEGNVAIYTEAQFIVNAAVTRRGYRRKHLSSSDARRLAMKGVLGVADYRRELEREGYTFEAVAALELELRADLADDRDVAAARKKQETDRAAEKQQAANDKAAREAALEARNALPTLNEYRRAYVRGLLSRDAFANAIVREKVAITTDDLVILLEDADIDRAAVLEREEATAAARAKKPDPTLSLERYEDSVMRGILTLEQYARELVTRGYDADEQAILVAELHDRLAQQAEAKDARAAAVARAEVKSISLPDFERAVRLGLRSREEYAALLGQLDTSDVQQALALDLLDAQIEQDAAARVEREARAAAAAEKGIALSQRRRAVITGLRPRSYYEEALRAAGWSADDQVVELALVDAEMEQAAADRARRATLEAEHEAARLKREADAAAKAAAANEPPPAPTLSLAQFERGVKLGLLAPDDLRDEMYARGFLEADVELAVALVVAAIPDTRVAETRETVVAAELAAKNVSLADLQAGVLRGFRTPDEYEGELRTRGYGDDDVLLLRQLLDDRVAIAWTALRTSIAARLAKLEDAPTLDEILAAVAAGELDVATLVQVLMRFGVDEPTSTLFARMLGTFGAEA